jgi:hypothetical protein
MLLLSGCDGNRPAPDPGIAEDAARVGTAADRPAVRQLPQSLNAGRWDTSHVQGIAADVERGHLYFSFASVLVKTDFAGRLLGTVEGFPGHLGDLEFNPGDGMLYGSLDYKAADAFFIAVIDVERVTAVGTDPRDVLRTVYLPEVAADYAGEGGIDSEAHRFGTSGIDGLSFGPAFGTTDGPWLLTVGYAIFGAATGGGDDDQVLLQYDIAGWEPTAVPLGPDDVRRTGPGGAAGKYFVRTGNTTWGVQNLEYDCASKRWLLGVYAGRKPHYPNYTLFAVDASSAPRVGYVEDAVDGVGMRLELSGDGILDPSTGIRGWRQSAAVGLESLGGGLFYLASHSTESGLQTSDVALVRWTENSARPLQPVRDPVRSAGCRSTS